MSHIEPDHCQICTYYVLEIMKLENDWSKTDDYHGQMVHRIIYLKYYTEFIHVNLFIDFRGNIPEPQ